MLTRMTVYMTHQEQVALFCIARNETRDIREQIRWLLNQELERRGYLTRIISADNLIHAYITKIEVWETVPLTDLPNIMVDYEHVLNLERLSETSFSLENLLEGIEVMESLIGISLEIDRRIQISPIRDELKSHVPITTPKPALFAPEKKKSPPLQIFYYVFVFFPRTIGRAILDVLGRDKAADSTAVLIGYILIIVAVQVMRGTLPMNLFIEKFMDIWRFFFPVM